MFNGLVLVNTVIFADNSTIGRGEAGKFDAAALSLSLSQAKPKPEPCSLLPVGDAGVWSVRVGFYYATLDLSGVFARISGAFSSMRVTSS